MEKLILVDRYGEALETCCTGELHSIAHTKGLKLNGILYHDVYFESTITKATDTHLWQLEAVICENSRENLTPIVCTEEISTLHFVFLHILPSCTN